jgi:hypothetical protein
MKLFVRMQMRALAAIAVALAAVPAVVFAQTDEIQVYDGDIAQRGEFNITWHNNFTPKGQKTPAFPGGLANDKTLNGVTEWRTAVRDSLQARAKVAPFEGNQLPAVM